MDKKSKFGESSVYEKMGKKWKNVEMGVMGRPAVAMGGGVVTEWWCGGGWVVGFGDWWCLGMWEMRENGSEGGKGVHRRVENEMGRGKVT
jgi:hypothetical protein